MTTPTIMIGVLADTVIFYALLDEKDTHYQLFRIVADVFHFAEIDRFSQIQYSDCWRQLGREYCVFAGHRVFPL